MSDYALRRLGVIPSLDCGGEGKMGRDRSGRENRDRGAFDADPTTREGAGLLTPGLILQTFLIGSQGNSEGKTCIRISNFSLPNTLPFI